MGLPVTVNYANLNFGGVLPNSTGPDVTQYDPTRLTLSAGMVTLTAPSDANVTVQLTGQARSYFAIASFDVYKWVTQEISRNELPPGFKGQLPKETVLQLVAHSDGSSPVSVTAGEVIYLAVQYHAPSTQVFEGAKASLVIQGTSWNKVQLPLSFIISGVSTTIRTLTPVILPQGQRVSVLIAVTVQAGPDTDMIFQQSLTQLDSGVTMPPITVRASSSPTFAYLLFDVAPDAPLGDNQLAIDQIGLTRTSFFMPVTVTVDKPASWEFIGPSAYVMPPSPQFPVSGRVNAMAFDPKRPGTWYLGAATGGVWKTSNFGGTWRPMTDGWKFLPLSISSIAVDPADTDVIYAGSGDAPGTAGPNYGMGLMKSSDGGLTWSAMGPDELRNKTISKVLVNPKSPGVLWATSTKPGEVWCSRDGGQRWERALPISAPWFDIAYAASNDRCYVVAEGGPELWRTDDDGKSWQKLPSPFSSRSRRSRFGVTHQHPLVACSPVFADTVYLFFPIKGLSPPGNIFASRDAGNTWTEITDNWADAGDLHAVCLACSVVRQPGGAVEDVLYVGKQWLFRSSPGAKGHWQEVEGQYTGHADQHAIAINPRDPNSLLVGNDGGVFSVTYVPEIGITTVASLNQSLAITQVYCADYSHDVESPAIIAGAQDVGTAGSYEGSWNMVGGGDGGSCLINPQAEELQYLQDNFRDDTNLFRTIDAWRTKRNIALDRMKNETRFINSPMALDPKNPSVLYVATNFLYRWPDPGLVEVDDGDIQRLWVQHVGNQSFSSSGNVNVISVAPSDSNRIYVGSSDNELWMSMDFGKTWRRIDAGLPTTGGISSVSVAPNNPNDILVTILTPPSGTAQVWHCSDTSLPTPSARVKKPGGKSLRWENVANRVLPSTVSRPGGAGSNPLPSIPTSSIVRDLTRPSMRWYVGTDGGVFFTNDVGFNWYNWPLGLPNAPITQLKVVAETRSLYAATFGRGIWRTSV